tara:strand:+ start:5291 stop:5761 length:471 start_codon:yes stop_codon:yes gene_type:complete
VNSNRESNKLAVVVSRIKSLLTQTQATFASLPQTSSKSPQREHGHLEASMPRKRTAKKAGLPATNENVPTPTERTAAGNAKLKKLDERIKEYDERISAWNDRLKKLDEQIKELDERIAAKDEEIADYKKIGQWIKQEIAHCQKGQQFIAKKKVNLQ